MSLTERFLCALGIILIAAGIVLQSWIAFALFSVILIAILYQHTLDRLVPIKFPDPTGLQLLEALEEHRLQNAQELQALKSKLEMRQAFGRS